MHALGRLITERMDHPDHRWSFRDVERRARASKEQLSKSTVEKLKSQMTPLISNATIRGLAVGLGVTPLTVGTAVLESWGINTRPVEVTDTVATVEIDPSLSVSNRRQLLALIREMRGDSTRSPDEVEARTTPRAQMIAKRLDAAATAATEVKVDGGDDNA